MTVIIALAAEGKKKGVVVADRSLSIYNTGMILQDYWKKGIVLSDNLMVIMAGSLLNEFQLRELAVTTEGSSNFGDAADRILEQFIAWRHKKMCREITVTRGCELEDFRSADSSEFEDFHKDFNFGSALMIAGIDDIGVHFSEIDGQGEMRIDSLGALTYGAGWNTSLYYLLSETGSSRYSPDLSLEEAIWIAFRAKKFCETQKGIGFGTDVWLLSEGRIQELKITEHLEERLVEFRKKTRELNGQICQSISEVLKASDRETGATGSA